MKKIIGYVVLVSFALVCQLGVLHCMPSYNDVLLVVRTGNAGSEDVATYFANARKLPAANVFRPTGLSATSDPMSKADRDSLALQISNYLSTSGLADTINYIELSYGFPMTATDDDTYATIVSQLEIFLMYRLSGNKYTFVTDNPYGFLKTLNYNNRDDIGFSKNKYGYYIVQRIDGMNPNSAKRMIDNSGPACFDSWKGGIKFIHEIAGLLPVHRSEIVARGVNVVDWDTATGPIRNITDINFAFLNWASGIDEISTFENAWKRLSFKPGSLMAIHRSFPANINRNLIGGFASWLASTEVQTAYIGSAYARPDNPVTLSQNSIAIDTVAHQVWTAAGFFPGWIGLSGVDTLTAESEDLRGGGVVVYNKSGVLITNYTKKSTSGGLISDAVYEVRYDQWNRRMWVGTFRGLCYYSLDTGTWTSVPGLSDLSASGRDQIFDIYVDPTTSGRYVYTTFMDSTWKVMPTNPNRRQVNELDTTTGNVKVFSLGFNGYKMSIVKTDPTSIWVYANQAQATGSNWIMKINTTTSAIEQQLLLNNIDGTNFSGNVYYERLQNRISADVVGGNHYVYVPVCSKDAGKEYNGILRIHDQGATYARTFFGSSSWWYTDGGRSDVDSMKAFASFTDPNNPGDVYLITRAHITSWMGRIIRFSDATPAGVEIRQGGYPIRDSINRVIFDDEVPGKLWIVRTHTHEIGQQPLMDFFTDGLSTGMGGASHDTWKYDGSTFVSPPRADSALISTSDPDYAIYDSTLFASTTALMPPISIRLLDGVSMAEAKYGVSRHAACSGDSGFVGNQFVMDPKMAPYAPRVDFAASDTVFAATAGGICASIKIFSPTVRPDRNIFLASTINTTTVFLTNSIGAAIPLTAITYSPSANTITVTADAGIPNGSYGLVLKGGRTGIKNSMGAVIVNTSPTEFSDDVSVPLLKNISGDTTAPTVQAPASFWTNTAFSTNITVDENYGYWSTNSLSGPYTQFSTPKTSIAFDWTTTLWFYGRDAAGNNSETNYAVYTIAGISVSPKILSAQAVLNAISNTVDIASQLEAPTAPYDVRYSYRMSGNITWLQLNGNSIIGKTNGLTGTVGFGRWYLRNIDTSKHYDILIESGIGGHFGQTYEISSISLRNMFSVQSNLSNAVAINNPYRGGDGITFVNLAPDTSAAIYTVSGRLIARIPAETADAGRLVWNVKMNDGKKAGPGVYLCVLSSPRESKTMKVMVAQ